MIQIDMEMPKCCDECPCCDHEEIMGECYCNIDAAIMRIPYDVASEKRDDRCPLQEVHDTNIGKWTSVKDRLPERPGKYLVVSKTALAELPPHVKTAWFLKSLRDNSQFKYEGEPNEPGFYNGDGEGDWVERYVTYWMPLPEPPKEET